VRVGQTGYGRITIGLIEALVIRDVHGPINAGRIFANCPTDKYVHFSRSDLYPLQPVLFTTGYGLLVDFVASLAVDLLAQLAR